ncbi:MAG: PQQ-binding-like beta-propeller repeat protein [Pseudomonadota bacterium]
MKYGCKIFFVAAVLISFIGGCSSGGDKKKSGKIELVHAWYVDVFKAHQFGSPKHENVSPVIVGDDIFQGASDGRLLVVSKRLGSVKRVIKNSGGLDASPLYYQGVLYFGNNDGEVKAFSYRTGDYLWTYNTGYPIDSSPAICDNRLFVMSSEDILYSLDAVTGKVIWSIKRDFPGRRPIVKWSSSPVCFDNTVYVGFSDGSLIGADVTSGTVVLEKKLNSKGKFKDIDATPYVDEKMVIIPSYDGNLYCLDRKTGGEIWNIKDGSAKAVTVMNDVVYFSSNEGNLYAIDIKDGRVRWNSKLKSGIPTSPAVLDDYLVVGSSERGIMLFNKNDGKFVAEFNSGTGVFADPVVEDNNIYFLTNYGVLHSLYKL